MVRFGIVGTNWITEKFLDGASLVEDFSLNAVYSRTSDKAEEFAKKYGVENTFTDLESMAKSDLIDAVYIASPNSLHSEQAQAFLRNKKHVLCEKPIASNSSELKQMIYTAQEHGVLLMEAMKSTVLPNFQRVQENLHKIGKVRRYFANYCQYSSRYDAYKEGTVLNAFKPEFSNGALMDIGIYSIYPLVVLFGRPTQVQANGFMLESGVDGEGSVLLTYEDMEAVVMYSKITDSSLPSEIQGESGNIRIDRISTQEIVEIISRDGSIEDISAEQVSNAMYYEAREFVDLILAGKIESDKNTYENSLIVVEILDEVRKQIGVVFPSDGI
ncbi:Gfo/Idh/MocA family oxidoreductase [Peribacillus cavernae]|uniref:Gfo/Idh/MocA family oxidoreductase n=1 Tax=Peribacillus cavernae TaxID=1674310 RepID=A0A433HP83_9BACI|nr:Gfo/Idh/MocA family oxidoreductase [Peribacillus cavernae]MDQ0217447.1 putative dehydrogenase [Peribacillus cavernae]RUQ30109.1 Gfo/Idh/MocA family oxidoreductase [Peribacillus cavernae]